MCACWNFKGGKSFCLISYEGLAKNTSHLQFKSDLLYHLNKISSSNISWKHHS